MKPLDPFWSSLAERDPKPVVIRHLILWLVGLSIYSAMLYFLSPKYRFDAGFNEEVRIAQHLARGEGFLSPFDERPDAPPSSWCPPVYPLLISASFRCFGDNLGQVAASIILFNLVLRTLCAAAIFTLGYQLFGRTAAAMAAMLFLGHPMFLHVADAMWDNYLSLCIFLWTLCWILWMGKRKQSSLSQAAMLGAALGILLLTNTSYALACPAIALLGTVCLNWRKRLAWLAVCAAVGLVVLLPWSIRNYRVFHRPIFVRGNATVELWLGNQPDSDGWMSLAALDRHPSRDLAEQHWVLERGETDYFAYCGRRFIAEVHADPARFWLLCGIRFVDSFIRDTGQTGAFLWRDNGTDRSVINGFFATAGLAGLYLAMRTRQRGGALFGISLLAMFPYFFTQVYNRYAMPLRAMLVLFAGQLIAQLIFAAVRWARPRDSELHAHPQFAHHRTA